MKESEILAGIQVQRRGAVRHAHHQLRRQQQLHSRRGKYLVVAGERIVQRKVAKAQSDEWKLDR